MQKRFVIESSVDRRVWLHFRDPVRAEWRDLEVPRSATLPSGSALFEWTEAGELPPAIEFAIKSEASGHVVWDNNEARNYRLGLSDGPLLRVPIVLASWSRYKDKVSGFAYVRNLSHHKKVRAHVSADGGVTFRPFEATYKPTLTTGPTSVLIFPNAHGCEAWEFSIPITEGIRELLMYLEYEVGGEKHYDDNDRRLHELELIAPAG
jgi:hypothetical protein